MSVVSARPRFSVRRIVAPALAVLPVLLGTAACGSDSSGSSGGTGKVSVTADDKSCKPSTTTAAAGPSTFRVRNDGSQVTELYVYAPGDRVVGEVEQVGPGISRDLTVELQAGSYQLACKPGMTGDGIRTAFAVTGGAAPVASTDPRLAQAVAQYRSFVVLEAENLVQQTKTFSAAVESGDVGRAKSLYPSTREPYERIEPVAEALGNLDPRIDAREGDVAAGQWGGFHRIEKALWAGNDLAGMRPVAQALLADVSAVQAQIEKAELTPANLGNGANELLSEVATSKVTGEEERYSHTDLWDFAANVDGADKAYTALRPVLLTKDKALAEQLDGQFDQVRAALAPYRRGAGWVLYNQLNPSQTKALADRVDALAEPLSRLTAAVVKA